MAALGVSVLAEKVHKRGYAQFWAICLKKVNGFPMVPNLNLQ
jgi:hypothetical protein